MPASNIKKPKSRVKITCHDFSGKVVPLLERAARAALAADGYTGTGEINFILIPDADIRAMNRRFRKVNRITDVISFQYEKDPLRGDIYIGRTRSRRQAKKQGHDWERELSYLVIHGTLHLRDYTDYTTRARRAMFRLQDTVFQCLFS